MAGTIQNAMSQAVTAGAAAAVAMGKSHQATINEEKQEEKEKVAYGRKLSILENRNRYAEAREAAEVQLEQMRQERVIQQQKLERIKLKRVKSADEAKMAAAKAEAKLVSARTARTEALIKRTEQLDARRRMKDGEEQR